MYSSGELLLPRSRNSRLPTPQRLITQMLPVFWLLSPYIWIAFETLIQIEFYNIFSLGSGFLCYLLSLSSTFYFEKFQTSRKVYMYNWMNTRHPCGKLHRWSVFPSLYPGPSQYDFVASPITMWRHLPSTMLALWLALSN